MESSRMKCSKCGSDNYIIQRERVRNKEKKGCLYFLVMNVLFGMIYWTYLLMKWMILFTVWLFILLPKRLIKKEPIKMPEFSVNTIAVCQDCGYSWKVR